MKKLNDKLGLILLIISIVYFTVRIILYFQKPFEGDEGLFISDLEVIKSMGWIEAIKKSISLPYMILAYPLSLFLKDYVALRLINIILLIIFLVYCYFRVNEFKKCVAYLLFYISTVTFFFFGTNDALFFYGLIIFFNETYRLIIHKEWKGTLAISMLLVSIFTRELFLVYLPMILFAIYLINRKAGWISVNVPIIISVFACFIIINLPSIMENGKISYDKKSPPSSINAGWAQRQYLAQLMVNEGKLQDGQHPSWIETDNYLEANGPNSLPKGIIQGIFFDLKLTIKEFFKDFAVSIFYAFRQLGLMFFIPLFLLFKKFRLSKLLDGTLFIPLSLFMMLSIFSLIIISYLELRWLAPVFILAIIYYNGIASQLKEIVVQLNYLVLISLSCYGLARNLGII